MRTSKSNANKLNNNKIYKAMKKVKTQKCSICGHRFEGFGHNAYPINEGRCCNMCQGRIVMPIRALTNHLVEIKERGESEVLQFTSPKYGGLSFEYVKELKVLTDFKGIYVRNFPEKELNNAVNFFEDIYLNFTSLICDYRNIERLQEELFEQEILEALNFEEDIEDEDIEDNEFELSNVNFEL